MRAGLRAILKVFIETGKDPACL